MNEPIRHLHNRLNDERTNHAPSQPFKRWMNQSRTFTNRAEHKNARFFAFPVLVEEEFFQNR